MAIAKPARWALKSLIIIIYAINFFCQGSSYGRIMKRPFPTTLEEVGFHVKGTKPIEMGQLIRAKFPFHLFICGGQIWKLRTSWLDRQQRCSGELKERPNWQLRIGPCCSLTGFHKFHCLSFNQNYTSPKIKWLDFQLSKVQLTDLAAWPVTIFNIRCSVSELL